MKKLSLTPTKTLKRHSRLQLKKRKPSNFNSSKRDLSLSQKEISQKQSKRPLVSSHKTTPHKKTGLWPSTYNFKLPALLTAINPKIFSLSLLFYFVLFVFMDQVAPESVANLIAYKTYLPFHLLLFGANFFLALSFFNQKTSFLVAFIIELFLFLKLQGFLVTWILVLSLTLFGFFLWGLTYLWHYFKLERKLARFIPSKSYKSTNHRPTRLKRIKKKKPKFL